MKRMRRAAVLTCLVVAIVQVPSCRRTSAPDRDADLTPAPRMDPEHQERLKARKDATDMKVTGSGDWDFYLCQVDHKPASIFLDLGIRERAPLPNLHDLAWLRLHMRSPREDGLSSKEEYEALVDIENTLSHDLGPQSDRILFVGRNTSDGTRDFYFYTDDGAWAEPVLSRAMVPFPDYEFETGSRHDENWDVYLDFLFPSERQMQVIQNGRVLRALEKDGDRHDTVREVSHWAYFETADARDRFSNAVRSKGYREVSRRDDAEGSRPFGITVASDSDVNYETIIKVTLELFDFAKEVGGEYDGWETSVERGVDSDHDS